MKKNQSNKLNSFTSVKGVLEENRKLYENEAILKRTVEEFFDLLGEIDKVGALTKKDATGATAAKKLAKEKLARLVSVLAAAASVYAYETSNTEMEAALAMTYTDIRYTTDNLAFARAGTIEAELIPHRDKLLAYMIGEQDLVNLHQHILAYREALKERGGAKSESVAETKRFASLIREADKLLVRKLDRLVLRLQASHPSFYTAYHHARMVVDL